MPVRSATDANGDMVNAATYVMRSADVLQLPLVEIDDLMLLYTRTVRPCQAAVSAPDLPKHAERDAMSLAYTDYTSTPHTCVNEMGSLKCTGIGIFDKSCQQLRQGTQMMPPTCLADAVLHDAPQTHALVGLGRDAVAWLELR